MNETHPEPQHGAPISESQRDLLARLVRQGRVTTDQLKEAGVPNMSRSGLARWLDFNVLGTAADERIRGEIDELFEEAATEPILAHDPALEDAVA